MDSCGDVWVWVETDDGEARAAGLELLNPGGRIAAALGRRLSAVILGDGVEKAVQAAAAYGADRVIVTDEARFKDYDTDVFTEAMCVLIEKYRPGVLLLSATETGRDFAPRVACRMKTGLTADCTALDPDPETGGVLWTRPAFGGKLMAVIECQNARPEMGTVRPGVFKKRAADESRRTEIAIVRETLNLRAVSRVHLVERIAYAAESALRLEEADVIVAGGLGLGDAKNFSLIRELAGVLGGEAAASRGAVDAGWASHARQVGQTGKTVAPRLYIACGVSGAAQHLAGMSGADTIVAINQDPGASIFGVADYGIVGDVLDVIPALTEEIRRLRSLNP